MVKLAGSNSMEAEGKENVVIQRQDGKNLNSKGMVLGMPKIVAPVDTCIVCLKIVAPVDTCIVCLIGKQFQINLQE
ncbi:hypothetical protein L195_g053425 [Trifolium pratense]|uniref:Uncharacterized protein n=1 Tax=Trifolium pratense TaxID=57577 RepID=A0A2K3KAI0_TRIPR|nr:hypothetical protein L195_g053425 [Trifolium pratense]